MVVKELAILVTLLLVYCEARAAHSDVIETKFGSDNNGDGDDMDEKKPGWMRRQLLRFGELTSKVSGKLGGSAGKVALFVERLCKLLKTIVPIAAAVCRVGNFKFCTSGDAPLELQEAMLQPNPLVPDLNQPD